MRSALPGHGAEASATGDYRRDGAVRGAARWTRGRSCRALAGYRTARRAVRSGRQAAEKAGRAPDSHAGVTALPGRDPRRVLPADPGQHRLHLQRDHAEPGENHQPHQDHSRQVQALTASPGAAGARRARAAPPSKRVAVTRVQSARPYGSCAAGYRTLPCLVQQKTPGQRLRQRFGTHRVIHRSIRCQAATSSSSRTGRTGVRTGTGITRTSACNRTAACTGR